MAVVPTLLTGSGETSIQNTDNNPRAMDAAVYELEPNAAPLTQVMSALGSRKAGNPKVEWLTDESYPRLTQITASAAASATAFAVLNDIFRVGDTIKFPALGFGLLVSATGAGTVAGTVLGTTASAASGAEMFLIGNANAEFATLREIKFTQLNTIYNYAQIVRTPFGISGTEDATEHYGGDERARLRKKHGIEHARTLDDAMTWGIRSISSTTRTMGGITSYVTTNVTVGTTLTEAEWGDFLITAFRYGSGRKMLFASPLLSSILEGYAKATLRTQNEAATKVFGLDIRTYVSGQGTVDYVNVRKWNDSTTLGGYGILLDMEGGNVQERYLRKTRLRPDVQTPSADGFQDEYLTETCVQVKQERTCAILTGVTRPA